MDVRTRRLLAGERDTARQLFGLLADVFGEEHPPPGDDYLDRLLGSPDFWAIAAFLGDELVGGLTGHTLPLTRMEGAEVFIYDVAVRAEHRRRGVGRALLAALVEGAGAAGVREVFVAADDEDRHALDFYRALGGAPAQVTMFTFRRPPSERGLGTPARHEHSDQGRPSWPSSPCRRTGWMHCCRPTPPTTG